MNGNDKLLARDLLSDKVINCDGGNSPGHADSADLDKPPRDPNSKVKGCEVKTRHYERRRAAGERLPTAGAAARVHALEG